MKPIRVGVVGLGFVGHVHLENLRRVPHLDIQAIVDSDRKRLTEYQQFYAIPDAYPSWEKLAGDPNVDVVHNCTPNSIHYEVSRAFLEQDVGVISEKPLTVHTKEAEHLVDLADQKGLLNAVCFNYRFFPVVRQMKAMIDGGAIGDIWMLHGTYLQDWLSRPTDFDWKVEPRDGVLTRAVADIGSHWLDMAQFLTSESVTEVLADLSTFLPERIRPATAARPAEPVRMPTEDCASLLLTLGDGIKANMVVSQVAAGRKNRFNIEVNGSNGSLYWNQERPNVLWVGKRSEPNQEILDDPELLANPRFASYPGGHNEGWADAQRLMFEEIYRAAGRAGGASFATFKDGLSVLRIEQAAFRSASSRKWVAI